jgi:hypothetical protein
MGNSRVLWLAQVDENTHFFHNYEKTRKNINTIWSIKNKSGEQVHSFNDMEKVGTSPFNHPIKEPPR